MLKMYLIISERKKGFMFGKLGWNKGTIYMLDKSKMRWLKKNYHITSGKEDCKNGILEFRWLED